MVKSKVVSLGMRGKCEDLLDNWNAKKQYDKSKIRNLTWKVGEEKYKSLTLDCGCFMVQYKIKRDYWDWRYLWIWFLLTNWWFILLDLRKWSVNMNNNLIFAISYSIISIIMFPFGLLLIDWPINKWLLDKFNKYPVWYIIIWSTWLIFGLSYLIYTAILLYNLNW